MSEEKNSSAERDFWKKEEENLLKEWSDKAQCYHWMHLKSHRSYRRRYIMFTIPVIIISTITGTANFAQSMFGDYQTLASVIIGSMNIIAGIITTIYQFLKVAELNEGHRAAALGWEKFHEYIKIELAKNPLDREKPSKFLKYCSQQYDHLIEFSPIVPEGIIKDFKQTFRKFKDFEVPSIVGKLKGTHIFMEELIVRSPPVIEKQSFNEKSVDSSISIDEDSSLSKPRPSINEELESSDESSSSAKTPTKTTTESSV